jgi:hypothetical protein
MRYVIINTLDKTLIRLSPLVSVEPRRGIDRRLNNTRRRTTGQVNSPVSRYMYFEILTEMMGDKITIGPWNENRYQLTLVIVSRT